MFGGGVKSDVISWQCHLLDGPLLQGGPTFMVLVCSERADALDGSVTLMQEAKF